MSSSLKLAQLCCIFLLAASALAGGFTPVQCTTDKECKRSTERCVEVPIGGDRYCVLTHPYVPSFPCPTNFSYNQCCDDADCHAAGQQGGVCVTAPSVPYCGGAMPPPWNACNYNACENQTACVTRGLASCIPKGFYTGITNLCVPGDGCAKATDCKKGPGGACTFFDELPFCASITHVACTYEFSKCRKNSDCPKNQYNQQQVCVWLGEDGKTECQDPTPPPP